MEKKTKKKGSGVTLWSILSACTAILLVVAILGTNLALGSAQAINIAMKTPTNKMEGKDPAAMYFNSDFASVEELEAHDKLIAEQLAGEGAVLLMNKDNALPLKGDEKVSTFSHSAVDIVTCGGGSADIDTSKAPTFKKALEDVGLSVNPTLWDFYATGAAKDYIRTPSKGMNGLKTREEYHVNEVPTEAYTDAVKSSFTAYGDVAVVVIARLSGEMYDLPMGAFVDGTNVLSLTQQEQDMFKMVEAGGFKKTIVLINSTNAMECDFLTNGSYGIDAALWIGYTGTWGLNAVSNILVGNVNPSGKLVDTYANDNTTSPAMVDFYTHPYANAENGDPRWVPNMGLDGNKNYTVYQEGIYVGYRYYETRYEDTVMGQGNTKNYDYRADVAYPMGYGLSYTTFDWNDYKVNFNAAADQFEVSVKVTNTGKVEGKDVVEVYFQSPYTAYDKQNGIEKASVELCGFAKTQLLAPGASETVQVVIPREELATYDAKTAKTYILDAGDYYVAAGRDVHDAVNNILTAKGYTMEHGMDAAGTADLTYKYQNKTLDAKTYALSSATGAAITNQFDSGELATYGEDVTYLSRSDWQGTWPVSMEGLEANEDILSAMDLYQTYQAPADSTATMPTMNAKNGMTLAMMIGKDFDDPQWEKLLDQVTYEEMATLIGKGFHNTVLMTSVSKPATVDDNGPQGFTQALSGNKVCHCAYSDENTMAATWNVVLIEEVGKCIGNDMLDLGASGLYGPAMNIHRTPYSGRNFEYYSEDGFLSGKIAAAEVKGIQSKGVYVYIKHFALNDAETNCRCLAVWANEQSIREIYLKPFEMAVTEGGAKNVMNSFSRVGPIWTGAHSGLMTEVLRGEWGMDGFAITDFSGNSMFTAKGIFLKSFDVAHGLIAGTDTWDSSAAQWTDDLMNLYRDDPTMVSAMRQATHRILYTVANSNAMNGISEATRIVPVTPWWQTALICLDVMIGLAFAGSVIMLVLRIRKKKAATPIANHHKQ